MSIQSGNINNITYIPLDEIRRPIAPVLDHDKITAMSSTLLGTPMASLTCQIEDITSGELPPIDVMLVRDQGKSYYFAFGGCHRFQLYEQSGVTQVKCKLIPLTRKQLKLYLGSSVDKFFT